MNRASAFWDKLADRYAVQPIADEAAYQTKLATTRALLRPDMDLLEFGCGTGSTAILHAPHVRHITAIDFSARMIAIARAKASAANIANVTFRQDDIAALAGSGESYDMILGLSILHLLERPEQTIAQVFGLLKPGGFFVSSTACLSDTLPLLKFIAPLGKAAGLLPQLTVMSGDRLRGYLRHAGFTLTHDWQPGRGKALFLIAQKPQTMALAPPQKRLSA